MRLALLVLLAAPASAQGLDCLADALGGPAIDSLAALRLEVATDAPLGGAATQTAATVTLRPDAVTWESALGDARQTTRATAEAVTVVDAAGPRVLGGAAERRVRQAGWLHLPTLLWRRAEVAVEGDCDGLLKLTVPAFPEPLVVQLGEAGRPRLLSTFRERNGQRVYLAVRYGDYREVGGVWLPHRVAQAEGGVERGVTRVTGADPER